MDDGDENRLGVYKWMIVENIVEKNFKYPKNRRQTLDVDAVSYQ